MVAIATHSELQNIYFPLSRKTGHVCLVTASPGVGKSDSVRQYAKSLGWDGLPVHPDQKFGLVDWRALLRDEIDIKGMPIINHEENSYQWVQEGCLPMQSFVDDGLIPEYGILFFDEITAAEPALCKAMLEPILDHSINDKPLAKGWFIICAGNRQADQCGVGSTLSTITSRTFKVNLATHGSEWVKWANKEKLHPTVVAYFRLRMEEIDSFNPDNWDGEEPFCCPRTIHMLSDLICAYEEGTSEEESVPPVTLFQSSLGADIGGSVHSFFMLKDDLPLVSDIIEKPKTTMVPSKPDQQYALMAALIRVADDDNLMAISEYIQRMPGEFEMAFFESIDDSKFLVHAAMIAHCERFEEVYEKS